MPLKLHTPNRDSMAVVVNPYPILITGKGPGPPEQVLCFRPYEFDDENYKCIRLLSEHTAGPMCRRYPRLVKLSETKGWELSDAIDRLRSEHSDWDNREVLETAWQEVLNNPIPPLKGSKVDEIYETQLENRLEELNIPAKIYSNPDNPWPAWWKAMVVEEPALAWEDFSEYAQGETASVKGDASGGATKAREAREREREREQREESEKERKDALKEKARKSQMADRRRKEERGPGLDGLDAALDSAAKEAVT